MAKDSTFDSWAKRLLIELQEKPDFFTNDMKIFGAQKNIFLKVSFVESLFCKSTLYKELIRCQRRIPKSRGKSNSFFQSGQQLMFYGQHNQALAEYAKCICFSTPNSENIPLAYTKRAGIYLNQQKYEHCLKNIHMARKYRLSRDLVSQLNQLEDDSKNQPVQSAVDILSGGQVDNFPIDTQIIERAWDNGNKLVSKVDLLPWDIFGVEDPFMIYVPSATRYIVCSNCAEELVAPVPCPECPEVAYCSENCKDLAYNEFHQYECPLINYLQKILEEKNYSALRMTILAINLFPTRREAIEFFKHWEFGTCDLYDVDRKFTKLEHYKVISRWKTNPNMDTVLDEFLIALQTVIVRRALFAHSSILTESTEDETELFTSLLFHNLMTIPQNMCKIEKRSLYNTNETFETVAEGAYSVIRCIPEGYDYNVERLYYYNKMLFYAYKDIPKGTVLTQPVLFDGIQHKVRHSLKIFTNTEFFQIPPQFYFKDISKLFIRKEQHSTDSVKSICAYLEKFEVFYPCYQVLSAEHALWMSINIYLDNVPIDAYLSVPSEISNGPLY